MLSTWYWALIPGLPTICFSCIGGIMPKLMIQAFQNLLGLAVRRRSKLLYELRSPQNFELYRGSRTLRPGSRSVHFSSHRVRTFHIFPQYHRQDSHFSLPPNSAFGKLLAARSYLRFRFNDAPSFDLASEQFILNCLEQRSLAPRVKHRTGHASSLLRLSLSREKPPAPCAPPLTPFYQGPSMPRSTNSPSVGKQAITVAVSTFR